MLNRRSTIRNIVKPGTNASGSSGPDMMFVVDLYQDGQLVESRELPGKSIHYANDVSENWDTGIIKIEDNA